MSGKFASLHAGLLARKGHAQPAQPSALGQVDYVDHGPPPVRPASVPGPQRPVATRRPPRPVDADPLAQPDSHPCCGGQRLAELASRLPTSHGPLTCRAQMRLDSEQKRRLQTAALQLGWSQQRIMADALDDWLDKLAGDELGNCACMQRRPDTED
ncbi:hypothetical protein [Maricaulis sp. CAU 1757]